MPSPEIRPKAPKDLNDAEFLELDDLLSQLPEELPIGDAVTLDGFLCGVLVQPRVIGPDEWMQALLSGHVDDSGTEVVANMSAEWLERASTLMARRHALLAWSIAEDGWFSPFLLEEDEDEEADADAGDAAEAGAEEEPQQDPWEGLAPVSRVIAPWVWGFQLACERFESLLQTDNASVMLSLARLFRHLPIEDEEMRSVTEALDREDPLTTLDSAMEDLVGCVVDISELTSDERFHVDTVRRAEPKVGRNDPCPCGSGKKFKQCHGVN